MAGNKRISAQALVITASIDPSFQNVMTQWPQMVRTATGQASDYLGTLTTKQAKSFQSAYDNYGNFVNQMNTKIISSMGRSGQATEAHLSQLLALKQMADSVGDSINSVRLGTTIDFAEAMNLRTASELLDEIKQKTTSIHAANQVTWAASKPTLTQLSSTSTLGHGVTEQLNSKLLQEYAEANQKWLAANPALVAQQQAEAERISRGSAARRLDNPDAYNYSGPSGPNRGLSPAVRQMRHEEEFDRNANQLYQLGMSPSVRVRQGLEARHRADQFAEQDAQAEQARQQSRLAMPMSALAASGRTTFGDRFVDLQQQQAREKAQQEQRSQDLAAQARIALHSGSIEDYQRTLHSSSEDAWGGLSHGSAAQLRSQAVDRSWARAQAQSDRDMNEANDRRLAAGDPIAQYQADMARQNAQGYNLAPAGSQMRNGMLVPPSDPVTPARRPLESIADTLFRREHSLDANQAARTARAAERLAIVERDALAHTTDGFSSRFGPDGEEGTQVIPGRRRSIEGGRAREDRRTTNRNRLSREDSHAARFAAQNIGFGVDDAIQSYHYGGIGGSIRAASNNATAIAGMLISNPVTAAASVIGISIASAAVPIIMSRFGSDKAFGDRSATERFQRRNKAGSFWDEAPEKTFQDSKFVSEQTWVANQKAGLVGRNELNQQNWMKAASQKGGFTNFIDDMASKQVSAGAKFRQNQEELDLLKVNQVGLQLRASTEWDGTAKKELEKNLQRTEELERENRVINAERNNDAGLIREARNRLPANIARQAEMSKLDWETNAQFNRGELSIAEHDKRLEAKAALQLKNIAAQPFINPEERRRAELRVQNELLEAKADPDRERNRLLAVNVARQADRNFTERFSGDTSRYGAALAGTKDQLEANSRDRLSGTISLAEEARRDALVRKNFERTGRRASEDDLNDINPDKYNQRAAYFTRLREDIAFREPNQQATQLAMLDRSERRFKQDEINAINPETNPYKNMQRFLERQQEDIAAKNLNPADREAQTRAMLIAAEKRNEAMIPQARSFISRSTVGSMEDEELRARMVGNFGPQRFRDKHEGQNTEVMEGLLRQLVEELKLKGEAIGS